MAIVFFDGFDSYAQNVTDWVGTAPWTIGTFNAGIDRMRGITSPYGLGVQLASYNNLLSGLGASLLDYTISKSSGTIGVGFHVSLDADTAPPARDIFCFHNSATTSLFTIGRDSSQHIIIKNSAGTTIATGTATIADATYYHLEFKLIIGAGTSGSVEVRVDGVSDASATGIATNGTYTRLGLYGRNGAQNVGDVSNMPDHNYDNFFYWDESGSANNDWLGERFVETIFPSADVPDAGDWVPSTGTTNWEILDNVPRTAAYTEASNIADEAVVSLEDLASVDIAILAVRAQVYALKSGADPAEITYGLPGDGSPSTAVLTTSATPYWEVFENDPNTGLPWAPGDVNGLSLTLIKTV